MIYNKHGKKIELDSINNVAVLDYSVSDIDGNVIIATILKSGIRSRFNINELGMTNNNGGDNKHKISIDFRKNCVTSLRIEIAKCFESCLMLTWNKFRGAYLVMLQRPLIYF